jgi:hypothetical protein
MVLLLMNMKRRVERLGDPVARGGGFVVVVQVLTRDAAEGVDLPYVSLQHLRSVDEQISPLALKQEGANLERGSEPQ